MKTYIAWDKDTDTKVLPEREPVNGEWCKTTNSKNPKNFKFSHYRELIASIPSVIRKISTGAMQRRFTIPEEVFVSSDPAATVIKSRLLNASYADLDFQDTIDGVTYICSVLKASGIIEDEAARIVELLQDGTQDESI